MADEKTRKAAYRYVANAIDEFLEEYALDPNVDAIDPMVRVEMERIRDTMLAAGAIPPTGTARNGMNGTNGAAP